MADLGISKLKLVLIAWQRGNIISISRIREPFGVAPRRPLCEDNQRAKEVRKVSYLIIPIWEKSIESGENPQKGGEENDTGI